MEKNIMKMSESELADYLDECITHKIENQELPKDVAIEQIYHDIYKHIRMYFRIVQLQLNHIKARADMGKYFTIVMCRAMPKEKSDLIMAEINKLKEQDNQKIMNELKSHSETTPSKDG